MIAVTTILEMNTFTLLMVNTNIVNIYLLKYFTVFHAILAVQLFLLSDFIHKRYHTRKLNILVGLINNTPQLGFRIIFNLILFSGFPLTIKFIIEIALITKLLSLTLTIALILIMLISYLSVVVVFTKVISLCFGRRLNCKITDITVKEKLVFDLSIVISILLFFL